MSLIYRCDRCGTEQPYLSDSWSETWLFNVAPREQEFVHHCLGCRSDKREYRAAARAQGSLS